MELLGLLLVVAIVWWVLSVLLSGFRKGLQSTDPQPSSPEIEVTLTTHTSSGRSASLSGGRDHGKLNTGDLREVAGGFVLNPRSPLPLSMLGISRKDAESLKQDLDWLWVDYRVRQEVAFLVAQKNLRCAEIDAFVARQKKTVDEEVGKMLAASTEWAAASEKDRRDLFVGFQESAINTLQEKPPLSRGFRLLLDGPPRNAADDDELLALFDADVETYKTYMYALSTAQSVRAVPAEDTYRKRFESFADKGLARRGTEIPIADILGSLKLKELNELLKGTLEKPVGRKAKAIDLALKLPNLKDRLGSMISFRELFQVLPPADLDIDEVKRSFAWATEVADLFCETYAAGNQTLHTVAENREFEYKGWRIRADDCCTFCVALDGKRYKSRPSKLPPYHVGCTCDLEGMFADES